MYVSHCGILCASVWQAEAFKCTWAYERENFNNGRELRSQTSQTSLIVGIMGCQRAVSWEFLQMERLGEKYYLKAYCAIFSCGVQLQLVLLVRVCMWSNTCVVCLTSWLSGHHVTHWRKATSLHFLWLFNSFPPSAHTTPPSPPLRAANITPLCISSIQMRLSVWCAGFLWAPVGDEVEVC